MVSCRFHPPETVVLVPGMEGRDCLAATGYTPLRTKPSMCRTTPSPSTRGIARAEACTSSSTTSPRKTNSRSTSRHTLICAGPAQKIRAALAFISSGARSATLQTPPSSCSGIPRSSDPTTRTPKASIPTLSNILGDCGRSWVVGFGENSPLRPYHKSSYNSYIDYPLRGQNQSIVGEDFLHGLTLNRFILYGALGPAQNDSYYDDRSNYEYTLKSPKTTTRPLPALLIDYCGSQNFKPFTDCGLDLGWSHPNASKPPSWPANDCYHTCNKNYQFHRNRVTGTSAAHRTELTAEGILFHEQYVYLI
ncbi:hypothetical protein BC936DRAFT_150115 [Jimgerdemannia flammicorona]|uniref:cellulase n=1 Tax=Jimgerdemannia flammicorona TaxID=994334 RepID=A0A433CZG9_9FUNG|nr:hypothetical protein BC936DRAFT_150115 [Jimgerdemannia flammicorona]